MFIFDNGKEKNGYQKKKKKKNSDEYQANNRIHNGKK